MELRKPSLLHYYCSCGVCENQSETLIIEEVHAIARLGPNQVLYEGFYVAGYLGEGMPAQCTFYSAPSADAPELLPTLTFMDPKDGSIKDIIELDNYELVY